MNVFQPRPPEAALAHRRARWILVGQSGDWCDAARAFCGQGLGALQRWRMQSGLVVVTGHDGFETVLRDALNQAPCRLTVACEPGQLATINAAVARAVLQCSAPPTGAALRLSEQAPPFEGLLYHLLMPEPGIFHQWLHHPGRGCFEIARLHLESLSGNVPVDTGGISAEAAHEAQAALEAWQEEIAPIFSEQDRAEYLAGLPDDEEQPAPGEAPPLLDTSPQVTQVRPGEGWVGRGLMRAAPTEAPRAIATSWTGRYQGIEYEIELGKTALEARLAIRARARRSLPAPGSGVALMIEPPLGLAIVLRGTWVVQPGGGYATAALQRDRQRITAEQIRALHGAGKAMRVSITTMERGR